MNPDVALFRLINRGTANPLFDVVLTFLTRGNVVQAMLIGLGVVLLAGAYLRGEPGSIRLAWRILLVGGASVALGELIGSQVLKPLLDRPRPPLVIPDVRMLGIGLGTHASFPSAHAVNTAAVMATVSRGHPGWALPLMGYAAVIAYSRVYVGVHFPLDVLGGAALGVVVSELLWRLSGRLFGLA
ncbi:MAG: phosphatase PAP2 family protein [Armatimonadetes bacterium]|nr:phosphatase PAP2 family protein [Armatimonadota bacterium]